MSKRSKIEEEILQEYLKIHHNISNRQLKRVKENLKDVDIRIYEKLKTYDRESGVTNKRKEYINIMLKNYRKKFGESNKAYKERIHNERDKALESRGIKATSRKTKYLEFKGFSKEKEYSKIKVKNKSKVEKRMRKTKEAALKSPKKFLSNFLDNLKPSRSKIHMTAPKGFFNKLKNLKEKNPTKFKKNCIKAIIAFALITTSIGTYRIYNNNNNAVSSPSTTYTYETNENDYDNESQTFQEKDDSIELNENEEETFEDNLETEIENSTEESTIEISSAIHSLISSSNIGFNTEFQMENGLYYETPEETGSFGYYAKFQDSALRLTYIDAIYEDGKIVQYNASSGLSISDIIKENENATLSYHVETTNGHILGWNSANSNNIEASLLLGHINQLRTYISSENIKFLDSIDLNNISEISENTIQKISEIIQTAENTQKQSLNEQKNR